MGLLGVGWNVAGVLLMLGRGCCARWRFLEVAKVLLALGRGTWDYLA